MKYTAIQACIIIASVSLGMSGHKRSIIEAVLDGNTNEVQGFLQEGNTLDARDSHGRSPLMLAAEQGNIELTKTLVEAGADINAKDRYGFTAIDLIESILRRISFSSPEYLQERENKMRQEGISEESIKKRIQLIKDSSVPGPPKSEEDIRNLREVLRYLNESTKSAE